MDLDKIIQILTTQGTNSGIVIMAILFVWLFFEQRKDLKDERGKNTTVLEELSKSNNNIAESLNLLKSSMDNTNSTFKAHDERSIENFNNIEKDLIILKERRN